MKQENNAAENQKLQEEEGKNWLEWLVFVLSLLLVMALIAFLSYKAYDHVPSAPDLQVVYQHDPSPHAPHRYHIMVVNKGGETAEEVTVEVVLEKANQELEKAELQFPFSPQHSKREGWIIFSENPATADTIRARVVSYKKP